MKLKRSLQQKVKQQQAAKKNKCDPMIGCSSPRNKAKVTLIGFNKPMPTKQNKRHDLMDETVRKRALAQIAVFQLLSNAKLSFHAAERMSERGISTLEMLLGLVTVITLRDRKSGSEIVVTTYKKDLKNRSDLLGFILSAVLLVEYLMVLLVSKAVLG